MSNRSRLSADFETTTDPNDCRVWLWGTCDIDNPDNIVYGIDIQSFVKEISETNNSASGNTIYFHNLAFDGRFILDYLMIHLGYKHRIGGALRPGQFSTLISNMGKFYSITVKWKNGRKTEFRDSLKKLPFSVSHVAKAFDLEESKGTIDYEAHRPVGYEPTPAELDYLFNDVVIVAKALKKQFSTGMERLTVGSDSLAEFKRLTGTKYFKRMFPLLPDSMDQEIRRAYRGGFTYVNKRFARRIVGKGRVYDVNSLYPSVMYDRPMPYGEPVYFSGAPNPPEDRPLYVVTLTFTAKLKPDHIPCIQVKGSWRFNGVEYQEEIAEPVTLTCTSVDLALWMDHYDIEILSWEGGWYFHAVSGVFAEYIDKWMAVKATHTGGLRQIAKLMLNSLYGKFATNPNVTPKIPVLKETELGTIVSLEVGDEETRDPIYTPVGVFITAYARDITIRAAQQHFDVFLYADTDSLHLLDPDDAGDPGSLEVDAHKLGAWKLETVFEQALYVRAKTYTEYLADGTYITHIAGLPVDVANDVTFESYDGRKLTGKLNPWYVPGGVVLRDVGFNMPSLEDSSENFPLK